MAGLAAVTVPGAGGERGRLSHTCASFISALHLTGAAEGDAEGAHAAGRGAAVCHLLPGHAAADADPAGPHPAQPAHRLLQVAHPHGPTGKGPGQVRPQTRGRPLLWGGWACLWRWGDALCWDGGPSCPVPTPAPAQRRQEQTRWCPGPCSLLPLTEEEPAVSRAGARSGLCRLPLLVRRHPGGLAAPRGVPALSPGSPSGVP